MPEALIIQRLREDDAEAIGTLAWEVFWKFVRPVYEQRAVFAFREFCRKDSVCFRINRGHEFFGAILEDDLLVGVVEINRTNKLTMLYVHETQQDRGVGRSLVEFVTVYCRRRMPEIDRMVVNASPNSIGFYRHLGFIADDDTVREHKGIRFIPMYLPLP